jgi:serine/threonine protein phosphatase PrpC
MKRNHFLFGVCDGHGINGHLVAQFIREILP